MLQYGTVHKATLGLLKELMTLSCLQDFFLAGETALALQIGHRVSLDIDLFTLKNFDPEKLLSELGKYFAVSNAASSKNSLSFDASYGNNDVVKVDLIRYSYPLLRSVMQIDGIRLLSVEDIIPMKLSAIAGRGARKDFYDLFYLLKDFSLEEMFNLLGNKFPELNDFQIVKSLTYFADADREQDPQMLETVTWEEVKRKITSIAEVFVNNRQ